MDQVRPGTTLAKYPALKNLAVQVASQQTELLRDSEGSETRGNGRVMSAANKQVIKCWRESSWAPEGKVQSYL